MTSLPCIVVKNILVKKTKTAFALNVWSFGKFYFNFVHYSTKKLFCRGPKTVNLNLQFLNGYKVMVVSLLV